MTAIPPPGAPPVQPAQAVPPPQPPQFPTAGLYWSIPSPYGYPASVDAAGTVAAPLLAGFGIALIGLILSTSNPDAIPMRDPALVTLVTSVLALLGGVQCTFWARQYTVAPKDVMGWWPDLSAADNNARLRAEQLRGVQWRYAYLAGIWLARARTAYDGGIVALLASLSLVLVPNGNPAWRWLAVGIAGLGLLAELYWVLGPTRRALPGAARNFPTPADVQNRPEVQPGAYTGPAPTP